MAASKRILCLCLLGVWPFLTGAYAQQAGTTCDDSLRRELFRHPEKMGSIYYAYPVPENAVRTPAPKGYEPFYVSHYGRHGSRRLTSDERYTRVIDVFERHRLTPKGEEALHHLRTVWEEARGRGGDLTALGERQHRGIAERLYADYPQIFKGDAVVSARSTTATRCILSMAAFCERLKELNPKLRMVREANRRYMDYLAYDGPETEAFTSDTAHWRKAFRDFEKEHIDPQRLMKSFFAHPDSIPSPDELMMGLYWIAADMQNVDLGLFLYDWFLPEELFGIWQSVNYRMYVCNAAAPANGGVMPAGACSLLKNMVESADAAIRERTPCATLRFGHDTYLIRLLALMQVEGCARKETDPRRYWLAWQDYRVAPMAANVQLVFFRNKDGDVLVKVLHNEREVSLPLHDDRAPYYSWVAVRRYFLSLC